MVSLAKAQLIAAYHLWENFPGLHCCVDKVHKLNHQICSFLGNSKFTNARFLSQSKPRYYCKQLPKGQIYVNIVFSYSSIIITLSFIVISLLT